MGRPAERAPDWGRENPGRRASGLHRVWSDVVKRVIDVSLAVVLGVLTAPLVAFCAVVSAVVFRSRPLFVQHRIGRGGALIAVPKIRSLPVQTPASVDKYALNEFEVPPWGRFLRRTHIDELPQLWAVVRGDMSLVGPRPEMPRLAKAFSPRFAALRQDVRPGVTGLWQVSEALTGLISESPAYDMAYVRHRSTRLDLWIMWRTVVLYLPWGRPITIRDVPSWVWADPQPDLEALFSPSGGQ